MKIKIFNARITNGNDVLVFENRINEFIEKEINSKNKVVYDIRQTETLFSQRNQESTVLTITISYEEAVSLNEMIPSDKKINSQKDK